MLPAAQSYEDLCAKFRWNVPARYNIGVDVCDKWARGAERLALIYKRRPGEPGPEVVRYSFQELKRRSNRLANALRGRGLERDDRVGILLPQAPSVGNGPGAMAFRRMPLGPHSTARLRVMASTPALAMAEGTT